MMQFEVLLALDHLPTDGTASVLSLQYTCTKRRSRFQHQLPVAVLEVALPFTVERVGLGFDLEMTLGRDRLLEADNAFAGDRISELPVRAPMQKITVSALASGLVRMTALGPTPQPLPDIVIEAGKRLATDTVAVVIRPAP